MKNWRSGRRSGGSVKNLRRTKYFMERKGNTDPRELLVAIAEILHELHIPYLVSGGMAVFVWGRPRFTADIDIVVELTRAHLPKLQRALAALSLPGYVDREMMEEAWKRKGEFNFVDGTTGVKVDFWLLKDTPFDRSRLARAVEKEILGRTVRFTSPEDLILIKLQWYAITPSSRQLEDVASILKVSRETLDHSYLDVWAKKLAVADFLNEAKKGAQRRN